jgi:hypothetical protein
MNQATSNSMLNLTQLFQNSNKDFKSYDLNQGNASLLGMAAVLFDPRSRHSHLGSMFPLQHLSSDPQEIRSQVLAELSDDLFDAPTDDIFDDDIEPVPIDETRSMPAIHSSSFALLKETLDQVLRGENGLSDSHMAPTMNFQPTVFPQQQSQEQQQTMKRQLDFFQQQPQPSKRQRMAVTAEEDAARRFRPYQADQWSEKFEELLQFKQERGHCCVPHTFKENPSLARWVKRQRYQYKLKNEEKPSTMTDERVIALEQAGFIWDSHGAAWVDRLNELREYSKSNGHSNVPSNHPSSPQLATWVKCQRRQYKLFRDGKPSNMTLERIQELESLGFEWELRGSNKNIKKAPQLEALWF